MEASDCGGILGPYYPLPCIGTPHELSPQNTHIPVSSVLWHQPLPPLPWMTELPPNSLLLPPLPLCLLPHSARVILLKQKSDHASPPLRNQQYLPSQSEKKSEPVKWSARACTTNPTASASLVTSSLSIRPLPAAAAVARAFPITYQAGFHLRTFARADVPSLEFSSLPPCLLLSGAFPDHST